MSLTESEAEELRKKIKGEKPKSATFKPINKPISHRGARERSQPLKKHTAIQNQTKNRRQARKGRTQDINAMHLDKLLMAIQTYNRAEETD